METIKNVLVIILSTIIITNILINRVKTKKNIENLNENIKVCLDSNGTASISDSYNNILGQTITFTCAKKGIDNEN